jgi:DNA modification methylase
MPDPPLIKIRTDLSESEKLEKELVPDYYRVVEQKLAEWNSTLQLGREALENVDFTEAAKYFRKLAADLKRTELLITSRGKHNPKNTLNDLTGKEWLQHTKSWLVVDGTVQKTTEEIKDHPASFPPDLAEYFISFFSKQGQWVLDPFMGIGSTAEACWLTKRNCIGVELNPKYFAYTKTRVQGLIEKSLSPPIQSSNNPNIPSLDLPNKGKISCNSFGDTTQQLIWHLFHGDIHEWAKIIPPKSIPPISFVITSPPYWNMLRTSRGGVKSSQKQRMEQGYDAYYSDISADLGNISNYDAYLAALVKVFADLIPFLTPKAHLMIILQNCRPADGQMRPIAWDFANRMSKSFKLLQEFIWCQDQKFMGIWGWPTTYVSNVHHHYCLVFQKKAD